MAGHSPTGASLRTGTGLAAGGRSSIHRPGGRRRHQAERNHTSNPHLPWLPRRSLDNCLWFSSLSIPRILYITGIPSILGNSVLGGTFASSSTFSYHYPFSFTVSFRFLADSRWKMDDCRSSASSGAAERAQRYSGGLGGAASVTRGLRMSSPTLLRHM